MKIFNYQKDYISPQTELIDILPESILCQSGESPFSVTLEGMDEQNYTFTF